MRKYPKKLQELIDKDPELKYLYQQEEKTEYMKNNTVNTKTFYQKQKFGPVKNNEDK